MSCFFQISMNVHFTILVHKSVSTSKEVLNVAVMLAFLLSMAVMVNTANLEVCNTWRIGGRLWDTNKWECGYCHKGEAKMRRYLIDNPQ